MEKSQSTTITVPSAVETEPLLRAPHGLDEIIALFGHIHERGLEARITSFGGCFTFRPQRTGSKLSTHSWGIAMDLNSESNPQGSDGDMDSELIDIFRHAGFEWGGNWPGKIRDPMHFQFCTGY